MIDAKLQLDPAHPEKASLTATIDPLSLDLPSPPKGFHDELMGAQWFDAKAFPKITFTSTRVEMTGADTAKVTGDLSLHGITNPVTMTVTFNGGYPGLAGLDPNARIGFSATGELKRSDFGISYGIPAEGSTMGVSDTVKFNIETEMSGPALKAS
ncbi:MAG: YceI family protein [Asticcacaulis sp.]